MKTGIDRLKEIFWYSDSEPNEVLIALCHLICLPLAMCAEFPELPTFTVLGAIGSGLFQLWAVLWSGSIRLRLAAVQIATLIAVSTCVNLYIEGLLVGSRTGWVLILIFAIWNTVRVVKEKFERHGR